MAGGAGENLSNHRKFCRGFSAENIERQLVKGGIIVVVREGWGEVMVVEKVIDLNMLKQLSVQEFLSTCANRILASAHPDSCTINPLRITANCNIKKQNTAHQDSSKNLQNCCQEESDRLDISGINLQVSSVQDQASESSFVHQFGPERVDTPENDFCRAPPKNDF